jgi:hypothetical protein
VCAWLAACAPADDDRLATPAISVNDQMVNFISPSANVLWAVEEPASDTDWRAIDDAAAAIIASGGEIRRGGSGINDLEWAAETDWQAYLDTLIRAAAAARDAAAARNLDALFQANDLLYPPCEECHLQYHPGVREQEFN